MTWQSVQFSLPPWIEEVAPEGLVLSTLEERMRFVVELASRNVKAETGGPFGAAIFETASGKLIAPGVNRVVPSNIPTAHAEVMAISIAGQMVGSFTLAAVGMPAAELVTSSEPCSMCFGAIPWSGVRKMIFGATAEDAEAIGFDEGPKPENWIEALEERGIEVVAGFLAAEAGAALRAYGEGGYEVYNG